MGASGAKTVLGHTIEALLDLQEIMQMHHEEDVEYGCAENAIDNIFWIICNGYGVSERDAQDCVDALWDVLLDWSSEYSLYDRLLTVLQSYATVYPISAIRGLANN